MGGVGDVGKKHKEWKEGREKKGEMEEWCGCSYKMPQEKQTQEKEGKLEERKYGGESNSKKERKREGQKP